MKPVSKLMIASLGLLLTQFAFAAENESEGSAIVSQNREQKKHMTQRSGSSCKACLEPGYANKNDCFPMAYNQSANVSRITNLSFYGNFLYWEAIQEGMDIAVNTSAINNTPGTAFFQPDVASRWLLQEFKYNPGFKVGLGVDFSHDNWMGFAEYTRYRHDTTRSNPSVFDDDRELGVVKAWETNTSAGFNPFNRAFTIFNSVDFSSQWTLKYDAIDSGFSRPYYQGTHVVFVPFGGLRAQWISQKLTMTGLFTTNIQQDPTLTEVRIASNSWAIGPRGGFQGKWHLGWGFRFESDMAGSMLYTRYNTSQFHGEQVETSPPEETRGGKYRDYDVLRVVNEMTVGMGWGSYFSLFRRSRKSFGGHIDVLVAYDFKIFWNQNMMRQMRDLFVADVSHNPNNLYLHGLNIRGQLDF